MIVVPLFSARAGSVYHPDAINKIRATLVIPYSSTTRPYTPRLPRRSEPHVTAAAILISEQEVNPMRRNSRKPRPVGWVVHSAYVPRHDGPRRLEQAFRILLGAESGAGRISEVV